MEVMTWLKGVKQVVFNTLNVQLSSNWHNFYWQQEALFKPTNCTRLIHFKTADLRVVTFYILKLFNYLKCLKIQWKLITLTVLTPMLSVIVCPSLKPKSSFGPESPSWALLLISFSCFTHLQAGRDTHHIISTDTEINKASQQFFKLQHAAFHRTVQFVFSHHFTLKPPCPHLLKMVLQSYVEIKSVPSVPKANSYERTATCRQGMMLP